MARQGENSVGPSYRNIVRKELTRTPRRGTDWGPSTSSGAIPAASARVTKDQRKTGRKS